MINTHGFKLTQRGIGSDEQDHFVSIMSAEIHGWSIESMTEN
jgi:hypothetical protein